jgi:hypothetical protein
MNQTPEVSEPNAPLATAEGTNAGPEGVTGESPETIKGMRRQPCPCGSGKKFKNCHEGAPGYAVATDGTVDAAVAAPGAVDARGARGGTSVKPHFPGKQAKTIASQKDFHSYHFRRV